MAGEWTCIIHPQIRKDKPCKSPICAMDLIPVRKSSFSDKAIDPNAIQLSEEAAALADVQASKVSRQNPVKQVRLYGKIVPDERSLQSQTAHVSRPSLPSTPQSFSPPSKNCWKRSAWDNLN